MNRTRVMTTVAVMLAILALGGTGAALAGFAGLPGGDGDVKDAAFEPNAQAESIDPRLLAAFGVLRGTSIASARSQSTFAVTQAGGNPELARLALTTAAGTDIYVLPSSDGACLSSDDLVVSTCGRTDQVLAGQQFASTICSPFMKPDEVQVAGLIPDDAKNVRVVFDDGAVAPAVIRNNVFFMQTAKADPLPIQVVWDAADGRHEASTTVPRDAANEHCDTSVDPEEALRSVQAK